MGKILIPGSSGGGVGSDDVTAGKAQVLQGYKTVTTDSDDEVAEGQIVNRGNIVDTVELVNAHWDSKFLARMEQGYYSQNGQYKPCVAIPYAVLANVAGVDISKMLDTLTVAGKQGQIKSINTQDNNYRVNKSQAFGIDGWSDRNNPVFWIDFPHGNGYYHRADNHPHTCIDATSLGTADANSVLQGQTATSVHGVKFEGAIQRWICTTGDVITALGGEGFVWDDTHANRGRGIVVRIPNGYYIQGANWAFLPSPNHLPHNIRKGVNLNGTIGTMEDYGAGRVAFRNATFDGVLISGVANKGFILRSIPRFLNFKNTSNGYLGIQDGGMKFLNFYGGNTRQVSAPDVGCVFAHSINLSPFRYIKVGYKVFRFIGDGTNAQPARVSFEIGVTHVSNSGGESYNPASNTVLKDIGGTANSTSHVMTSTRPSAGDQSDHSQLYLTLDVSANQGHHFLYFMLGNIIHEYGNGVVSSNVVVNYIEFIN